MSLLDTDWILQSSVKRFSGQIHEETNYHMKQKMLTKFITWLKISRGRRQTSWLFTTEERNWPLNCQRQVTKKTMQDADLSAGCISTVLYRGSGGSKGESWERCTPLISSFLDMPLLQYNLANNDRVIIIALQIKISSYLVDDGRWKSKFTK